MNSLTISPGGEIALPDDLRARHGMCPETPIRVIETRSGVLLVPITQDPMSAELAQELAEWQSCSLETWDQFPYEDSEK